MTLDDAIAAHDIEAARRLLEGGAAADAGMELALAYSFDHGAEIVGLLVRFGAGPHHAEHDFQRTPLQCLAAAGDLDGVELLLARGADLAARDADGSTALDAAIAGGAWQTALRLLEAGAPSRNGAGDQLELARACLRGAAHHARIHDLRVILDAVPSSIADPSVAAETWTLAAGAGSSDDHLATIALVEERAGGEPWRLANRGVVIAGLVANAETIGDTTLRHVVGRLAPLTTEERERLGRAILVTAARGARAALARWLDAGVPIDARGEQRETPFLVAARRHDVAMLRLLLERGADPTLRDVHGRGAIAYARANPATPNAETLELLQSLGLPDERWTPDPPVPRAPAPPSTRDKLSLVVFVACVVIAVAVLLMLRCAERAS